MFYDDETENNDLGFDFVDAELMYDDNDEVVPSNIKASSADEALMLCLNLCGHVDLVQMERMSGISVHQLVLSLDGSAIFQDPAAFQYEDSWSIYDGWLPAPRYLCGNLPRKLELAKELQKRFPGRFETNITALEQRIPDKLSLSDIHISLGATWVPQELYSDFVTEFLELQNRIPVYLSTELSKWKVDISKEAGRSILNNYTYGTVDMSALKIIEATMNAKTVKVYDNRSTLHGNERILNVPATLEAQEKQQLIIQGFYEWTGKNPARRQQLEDAYNDAFVGYGYSPYDGSFLTLPGLNPNVQLYPHQRNAVARILLSDQNTLLCHDVGAGKTFEIIISAHELKRMGLSRKNLIVVPNNVLQATVEAHRYLYPDDNIQVIYPGKFTMAKRAAILEELRDGDYTATYIAYSSFDLILMSSQYWIEQLEDEIRQLRNSAAVEYRKGLRKMLQDQAELLTKKLAQMRLDAEDPPWLCFEDLGINTLIVDEAHNYKNIPYNSKADNIVGGNSTGSEKCKQMLAKCGCVERVVFATGTPLTNSIADLFVIMTYLQPEELKLRGIDSFDMWINAFAERETDYELDVDGSHLRLMTRFNSFRNLTELMSLFSSVCDFHHVDTHDANLPKWSGYRDIIVPKNAHQAAYIASLGERVEKIRTREVPRTEDNLLKVTTDGRKCALDIRLANPDLEEEPENSKLTVCAKEIKKLYDAYPGTCQIVFSDIGTPKSSFNVYDCLRRYLTELSIPEEQVAFIHDASTEAQRSQLFAAINAGTVRVAIGSTSKLGTGVNVQERLIALHHLSIPWKPSDIIQREGRILRRGNTCEQVFLYRYITEGTFDAYSWQLLQNKQHFISSFLSGTAAARDAQDVMDAVLSYAEVKMLAVGDPNIKKRCETANKLERAKIAYRQRQKQIADLNTVVATVPNQVKKLQALVATASLDLEYYKENKESIPKKERLAFGEELLEALSDNILRNNDSEFDTYQGFSVILPAGMVETYPHVFLISPKGGRYLVDMKVEKPYACTARIDSVLEHLDQRIQNLQQQIQQATQRYLQAKTDLAHGNPYEDEIEALSAELKALDEALQNKEEGAIA